MSALIITLPQSLPSAVAPCGAVWSDDGQTVKRHLDAPLNLLPHTPGAETVVVVAVALLSWHRLVLPKGTLDRNFLREGNPTRLRSVLDGLLEEHLLDEPDQCHFAIQPHAQADLAVWVAACDRAWLSAWLTALEQSGRAVSRIVPEMEPPHQLEPGPVTLQIMGMPGHAQLAWAGLQGVGVLPLSTASLALVDNASAGESHPRVLAEPGVAEAAEQHFSGHVSLQTAAQRALTAAQSEWDLAQFDLLRTRGTRTRKKLAVLGTSLLHAPQWKPARWAAMAVVLINLIGLQAWAWKEQSALAAKQAAINAILTTTFPEVRVPYDAPLQMAKALAELQRQSGVPSNSDLETMLGLFQTVAPEIAAPTAMEYMVGELRLKLLDPSAQTLNPVITRLQGHGYRAVLDGERLVLSLERRP